MKKARKESKEHTESISTPLGHIKVPSDIAEKPITDQIKDLLDKDK
jgi:predicted class III extradiol MEMO1 family dioxygenase